MWNSLEIILTLSSVFFCMNFSLKTMMSMNFMFCTKFEREDFCFGTPVLLFSSKENGTSPIDHKAHVCLSIIAAYLPKVCLYTCGFASSCIYWPSVLILVQDSRKKSISIFSPDDLVPVRAICCNSGHLLDGEKRWLANDICL